MNNLKQRLQQKTTHLSCDILTPEEAHISSGILKKGWKTIIKKKYI